MRLGPRQLSSLSGSFSMSSLSRSAPQIVYRFMVQRAAWAIPWLDHACAHCTPQCTLCHCLWVAPLAVRGIVLGLCRVTRAGGASDARGWVHWAAWAWWRCALLLRCPGRGHRQQGPHAVVSAHHPSCGRGYTGGHPNCGRCRWVPCVRVGHVNTSLWEGCSCST
jgi:hypothetical protein